MIKLNLQFLNRAAKEAAREAALKKELQLKMAKNAGLAIGGVAIAAATALLVKKYVKIENLEEDNFNEEMIKNDFELGQEGFVKEEAKVEKETTESNISDIDM